jgi:hypothetical protein
VTTNTPLSTFLRPHAGDITPRAYSESISIFELVELNISNTSESNRDWPYLAVSSTFLVEDPVSLKEKFTHTTKKKATKNLIRFSTSTIKLVSELWPRTLRFQAAR